MSNLKNMATTSFFAGNLMTEDELLPEDSIIGKFPVSIMRNSDEYDLSNVLILKMAEDRFRLVIECHRKTVIRKDYKSSSGAKIAFARFFSSSELQLLFEDTTPDWEPYFISKDGEWNIEPNRHAHPSAEEIIIPPSKWNTLFEPYRSPVTKDDERLMKSIMRFVLTCPTKVFAELSFEGLKSKYGIGTHRINRLFREYLNQTAAEFLKRERLARAIRFLARRRYNFDAVAIHLGYKSPEILQKHFFAHYNMDPRELLNPIVRKKTKCRAGGANKMTGIEQESRER